MLLRAPLHTILPYALFAAALLLLTAQYSHSYFPSPFDSSSPTDVKSLRDEPAERVSIPNTLHFVYLLSDPAAELRFEFKHYLSVYSAWYFWQPDSIILHTNAEPERLDDARNGTSGKWTKLILDLPVTVKDATAPSHAGNGKEIQNMEHKSDFVRVKVVSEYGGIYIDMDVYALRDIKVLRESGFSAIAGRQIEGQVNSGTFMSTKGARMIELWKEGMNYVYNGGWTTHSNEVITKVAERLVSEPGEMLIMEREAFAPGGWHSKEGKMLFDVHDDVASNLEGFKEGDELPSHVESFNDRWYYPDAFPSWSVDWSKTYLLHAFSPFRFGKDIIGFEHITPRYVLERRSNFARAVYPVVKDMYDHGLVLIDDAHDA